MTLLPRTFSARPSIASVVDAKLNSVPKAPADKPGGGTFHYFQAIPIYMKDDAGIYGYFNTYRAEVDAATGTALTIALAEEVASGNSSAVGILFEDGKGDRYPGLRRGDLPCLWVEDGAGQHVIIKLPDTLDETKRYIRTLADATKGVSTVGKLKEVFDGLIDADTAQRSPLARVLLGELSMERRTERLLAIAFGAVFVAASVIIAIFIPYPTPFQYTTFRIVLAIASAGFVSMTPGLLEIRVYNWLRGGGALAVFVIVYFYAPAALDLIHK